MSSFCTGKGVIQIYKREKGIPKMEIVDINSLKKQIVRELNSKKLSEVLPSIIDLAQRVGDMTLKQLCVNELYGYDANVEVPEYRKIPVIFYDKDGNEIRRYPTGSVLSLNEAMQSEYYPFRGAIEEMEKMIIDCGIRQFIVLKTPFEFIINGKVFTAYSFEYFANQIVPYVSSVKKRMNQAIDNIFFIESFQDDNSLKSLHKEVLKTSSKLFIDGYYRQAVLDSAIGLINRVKQKSLCYRLDNTPLMQTVFSPNKPILEIAENKDIQQGFMWLFSGAVMALRNANAHNLNCLITREECLEQLYFISHLHRLLDSSKLKPM